MRFVSTVCVISVVMAACSSSTSGNDAGTDASSPNDASKPDASDASASDAAADSSGCNVTESATLTGTMDGHTLTPKDAVTLSFGANSLAIAITDFSNACPFANATKKSSNVLTIDYTGSSPLAVGTSDLTQFDVQFANFDATCNSPDGESASSGSITFTRVDACGTAGTFDVMLNTDHVTGSFTAPACVPPEVDGGSCL